MNGLRRTSRIPRGFIHITRALLIKRFVRTFPVVRRAEPIESTLLRPMRTGGA